MRRSNDRPGDAAGTWQQVLPAAPIENHPRGAILYAPGDPAEDLLILNSGKIGLFLRSGEGRSLTLRMVEAGQLFGHVALAEEQYDAYAEALSDVRVQRVGREAVREAMTSNPPLGLLLIEELGRYRQAVSMRLDEVAFKSVPARLASLLLDLAQRHGGPQAASVPRHSHRQLAEMINAYRETVTKVINQFRAARLLEIETSTIILLNLRRLEELAQS